MESQPYRARNRHRARCGHGARSTDCQSFEPCHRRPASPALTNPRPRLPASTSPIRSDRLASLREAAAANRRRCKGYRQHELQQRVSRSGHGKGIINRWQAVKSERNKDQQAPRPLCIFIAGKRVASFLSVRCIRSCWPFCCAHRVMVEDFLDDRGEEGDRALARPPSPTFARVRRAQNMAIGLTGAPVALGSANGLTLNMNSQRSREAAASLNASRSARSST